MTFNLVTDPWIPVRLLDGRAETLGLLDVFRRASAISDLSVSVHERISLMRLLVCITQAALGAPDGADDWDGWGGDLEEKVSAYLDHWHTQFELFGDGPRFLQRKVAVKEPQPLAKIVFEMSTGNSALLLDHHGEGIRSYSPAFLARSILSYQNHFVGGSMGQAPEFKGEKGVAGPAINSLHAFLLGNTLRNTILLNCMDRETLGHLGSEKGFGRPVWEKNPSDTYLGRLVPMSCHLWIEGTGIRVAPGFVYSGFSKSGIREPSTTIIAGKREGVVANVLLRASLGRGIWRDLHCIAILSKDERMAPLSFLSHFTARHGSEVTFWSGELIKAKDAKILDALESRFTVPWQLFEDAGRIRYQHGVAFAESMESRLKAAVFIYGKTLKHENTAVELARRHYWHTLDHKSGILLELLKDAGTENDPMGNATFGQGNDPWTGAARKAARDAYDAACPRATPRQLEAYAAGLKQFKPKAATSNRKTAPTS